MVCSIFAIGAGTRPSEGTILVIPVLAPPGVGARALADVRAAIAAPIAAEGGTGRDVDGGQIFEVARWGGRCEGGNLVVTIREATSLEELFPDPNVHPGPGPNHTDVVGYVLLTVSTRYRVEPAPCGSKCVRSGCGCSKVCPA